MKTIKAISESKVYELAYDGQNPASGTVNGKKFTLNLVREKNGGYHLLIENRSYNAELVKITAEEKKIEVTINGNLYSFVFRDHFDELLERMGMGGLNEAKITDLKAPMPGLVLNIAVNGGSQVKKGDPLLVLEAMKMENVLKSPTDGIIKEIAVKQGDAVEKNQLLLNFE